MNAYLELLAQPEHKTVYTLNDEIANTNMTPRFTSAITSPLPKGITAQLIKASDNANTGANKKMIMLACVGIIVSFTISFRASANG